MCLLSGVRACVEDAIVDRHRLGRCALVALTNRSRAGASRGRSELTKAIRYYTDHGVRTILGMEYNREFYTTPQRYLTNVTPEQLGMAEDPTSEEIVEMGWKVAMNKALILPPADPVGYEQAAASFRSMMRMSDKQWQSMVVEGEIDGIAEFNSVTFDRLSGALGRLVLEPARNTIANNIAPGTRFARVPEPGACVWCLMIASRGAVYFPETVGSVNKYHDGCRCLGIEVKRDGSDLPQINRDLQELWDSSGSNSQADFNKAIKLRKLNGGSLWPELSTVKVPKYRGGGVSKAFPGEPLPKNLHRLVAHALFGWRDDLTKGGAWVKHSEESRMGHTWDTTRPGKVSKFNQDWTVQDIADAIVETLENPQKVFKAGPKRVVYREIKGTQVMVDYVVINGTVREGSYTAHPVEKLPKRGVFNVE